jgi:hypothetical protein
MFVKNYKASNEEKLQVMSADSIVPNPIFIDTRAITIHAPVERVWPWLVQMGSGRAGWYAYDWIDNAGHPSATSILQEFQHIAPGDILPALPGMKDVFFVYAVDSSCRLILIVPDINFGPRVSWEFFLKPMDPGYTRLIVRGRVAPHWLAAAPQSSSTPPGDQIFIERVYSLLAHFPRPIMLAVAGFGHGLMHTRQLSSIKIRAEAQNQRKYQA